LRKIDFLGGFQHLKTQNRGAKTSWQNSEHLEKAAAAAGDEISSKIGYFSIF
jgi:hypothetical protein